MTEEERVNTEKILPPHRYRCVSSISNERLNQLYNHAAALVYPSSYEGFGLPVLEAQKAGCPVIAYNASSIPEVIGNTPLLIKELGVAEMVEKLHLLADVELMKQVRAEGLTNVQRFSWQKMADDYHALYQNVWRDFCSR